MGKCSQFPDYGMRFQKKKSCLREATYGYTLQKSSRLSPLTLPFAVFKQVFYRDICKPLGELGAESLLG